MKNRLIVALLAMSAISCVAQGSTGHEQQNTTQLLTHLKNTKQQLQSFLKEINAASINLNEKWNTEKGEGLYSLVYGVYAEFSDTNSEKQLTQEYIQAFFNGIYNDRKTLEEMHKYITTTQEVKDFPSLEDQKEVLLDIFTQHHKEYCQKDAQNEALHTISITNFTDDLYCLFILGLMRAYRLHNGLLEKVDALIEELEASI